MVKRRISSVLLGWQKVFVNTLISTVGKAYNSLIVTFVIALFILSGCTPKHKGFVIKGMKGYGWTPEICLEEVATLKEYGLNFFAPCYSSFFAEHDIEVFEELDGYNLWWKPMNDDLKARWSKVVKACEEERIIFCFGMNPMLFSPRPLDPAKDEDFDALLAKYRWFQEQGVSWFYIAIDDLHLQSHLEIDAVGQSLFTNKLYAALKEHDSQCRMIFCPTWYRGKDLKVSEKRAYLEQLAETLHKDILVFWTGEYTVSPEVSVDDVMRYKDVVKHEMILWDNYPVNDYHNTMNVAPLTGREGGISEVLYGMMANPMRDNLMTRLPLYTMADFMNNPYGYDPERSIAAAIDHIAQNDVQKALLEGLVQYYSSNLKFGSRTTKFFPVRDEFGRLLADNRGEAEVYMNGLQALYDGLCSEYADETYALTKEIVRKDVEWMKSELSK